MGIFRGKRVVFGFYVHTVNKCEDLSLDDAKEHTVAWCVIKVTHGVRRRRPKIWRKRWKADVDNTS
jgi:hypothetical protein